MNAIKQGGTNFFFYLFSGCESWICFGKKECGEIVFANNGPWSEGGFHRKTMRLGIGVRPHLITGYFRHSKPLLLSQNLSSRDPKTFFENKSYCALFVIFPEKKTCHKSNPQISCKCFRKRDRIQGTQSRLEHAPVDIGRTSTAIQ